MGSIPRVAVMMFLSMALVGPILAQVQQAWVAFYDGPSRNRDHATAIAVDRHGNVYVTGGSARDGTSAGYATVKYDPDGNELWVAHYNGSANSSTNEARAIAVDDDGNIYVTGRIVNSGTRNDYVTVKYNSSGRELWAASYNGPANESDEAAAIAVDGNGNVHVTGWSKAVDNTDEYATIKYDTNGNQLWVNRYRGGSTGIHNARDIALDADGNVFVTGRSRGANTGFDYATVKYSRDGIELWAARYNGPRNTQDGAWAIAVDSDGNAYVTGQAGVEYATVKYDPDGTELWVASYSGPGGLDEARAIAVDRNGNAIVTGTSKGDNPYSDIATVKFDGTTGEQLWAARYRGPANRVDQGRAVAVDNAGNIYVTGASEGDGTGLDFVTIKYGPDGNELWVMRYDGPRSQGDYALAVALGPSGNVYVTGPGIGSGRTEDYITVKYIQSSGVQEYPAGSLRPEARISPNPLKGGMATLRFEGLGHVPRLTVTVFDIPGRSVLSRNVAASQSEVVSLDLRNLSAGIYLVQVEAEGFGGTQKLVVQR